MKILLRFSLFLFFPAILFTFFSCINRQQNNVLFEDPLNGELVEGWKIPPADFFDHPVHGKVCQIESELFVENLPWVGDETWTNYRVEIEILSTGGHWVGLDCHVQDDGLSGFNIQFFTFDTTREVTVEAAAFNGGYKDGATAWKLWPVSQKNQLLETDQWIKFRIDVGETIVNAYINDLTDPVFTVYDMPYSAGGVRLFAYYKGTTYFRNFRVTKLAGDVIKPILEDPWKHVRDLGIIREWQITHPQPSEFGLESPPEELSSPDMNWIEAVTDERGVMNIGALFPDQNTKGTVFAKTIVNSEAEEIRKAWVTYTDRCTVWCNGTEIFKGPKRGWNDPEANHDCRLEPDQFEIEFSLKEGENEVLLRSKVTERWGWGFWMRLE